MAQIKKGVDPIGTEHVFEMWTGGKKSEAAYRVESVQGVNNHIPATGEPVVYAVLARRYALAHQSRLALPLSIFAEEARPASEGDRFWVDEKTVAA